MNTRQAHATAVNQHWRERTRYEQRGTVGVTDVQVPGAPMGAALPVLLDAPVRAHELAAFDRTARHRQARHGRARRQTWKARVSMIWCRVFGCTLGLSQPAAHRCPPVSEDGEAEGRMMSINPSCQPQTLTKCATT